MERQYQENGVIPLHDYDQYSNEFGLIDFLDEAVFDQFVDLIRGEGIDQSHLPVNVNIVDTHETYDCNNIVGLSNFDGGFLPPPSNPLELFDFDVDAAAVVHGGDIGCDYDLQNGGRKGVEDKEDEMMDDEESSGTTTTTTATPPLKGKSKKGDRSRTLISERRRRSRMKDKLYALRSLVPNITKMDKASIVGDAVLYVKDLQMQAKKLRAEVSNLEQSLARGGGNQGRSTTDDQNTNKIHATNFYPITKKILKMDVFQVEERGFYVRIVCNKGKGVAMLLYKALESLTSFTVETSNLATSTAGNYVFTFALHIMEQEMDINLSNLKLWIASIFLNKGFELETSQSI